MSLKSTLSRVKFGLGGEKGHNSGRHESRTTTTDFQVPHV